MSKIWNTPMNTPLKSSRLVRRVILDENLSAGWPVKWGGKWDLAMNGKLIPTGLTSVCNILLQMYLQKYMRAT